MIGVIEPFPNSKLKMRYGQVQCAYRAYPEPDKKNDLEAKLCQDMGELCIFFVGPA